MLEEFVFFLSFLTFGHLLQDFTSWVPVGLPIVESYKLYLAEHLLGVFSECDIQLNSKGEKDM